MIGALAKHKLLIFALLNLAGASHLDFVIGANSCQPTTNVSPLSVQTDCTSIGGNEAENFNDATKTSNIISSITCYYSLYPFFNTKGSVPTALVISYRNADGTETTVQHGNFRESDSKASLQLKSDEYLIKAWMLKGNVIDTLRLKTNKGRTLNCDNDVLHTEKTPDEQTARTGNFISGVSGNVFDSSVTVTNSCNALAFHALTFRQFPLTCMGLGIKPTTGAAPTTLMPDEKTSTPTTTATTASGNSDSSVTPTTEENSSSSSSSSTGSTDEPFTTAPSGASLEDPTSGATSDAPLNPTKAGATSTKPAATSNTNAEGESKSGFQKVGIPIIATIIPIAFVASIAFLVLWMRRRSARAREEEAKDALPLPKHYPPPTTITSHPQEDNDPSAGGPFTLANDLETGPQHGTHAVDHPSPINIVATEMLVPCRTCGTQISQASVFCNSCGFATAQLDNARRNPSFPIAATVACQSSPSEGERPLAVGNLTGEEERVLRKGAVAVNPSSDLDTQTRARQFSL